MASSSSSPRLSRLLLPVILVLLGGRGGEARQPPPLHGVRPMAFVEGYTQIFGSANLALHGEGKRVHLSLDESTGEYCNTQLSDPLYLCNFRVSWGAHCAFLYRESVPVLQFGRQREDGVAILVTSGCPWQN